MGETAPRTVEELLRGQLSVAVGGLRGSAEAALPTVAFVIVWAATKNLTASLTASAGVLVIAGIVRMIQHGTLRYVASAAFATAIAAFFALRSHNAANVYLPGILQAGAMLAVNVISIVARWPLVGFIASAGDPHFAEDPLAWRRSPGMITVCTRLTWVFAALFAIRIGVMLPLYLTHHVTALGVVKLILGWPLYLGALGAMIALLMRGHTPLEADDPLREELRDATA